MYKVKIQIQDFELWTKINKPVKFKEDRPYVQVYVALEPVCVLE